MQTGLIIAYPLLVHFTVVTRAPLLQALAIVVLAAGLLYTPLRKGHKSAWLILLVVGLLALASGWAEVAIYALYIPPILLPMLLLGVFGRTLLPGQTPLVTAIGEQARGPLSAEMRRYTSRVTALWALTFFAMITCSLLLPWLASKELWSLFTNLINYLVVGTLFGGEYLYRRYRFRDHDHPSFPEYLRIVIQTDIRKV